MKNRILVIGIIVMLLVSLLACAAPALAPTTTAAPTTAAGTSAKPATATAAPTAAATTATSGKAKPEGSLVVAISDFGNENFLPWIATATTSQLILLVTDCLIYYEETTGKFIPGLAERWQLSADALTHTFYIRKGVQWHDGWGEVTAADVKFTFEKCASPISTGNKLAVSRQIASMETPDPYTLVVRLKAPDPVWWQQWSLGFGAMNQGIACKKYVETVGETVAGQKPVGSGPYKIVEQKVSSNYKFEAYDEHWRVVPEFKNITLRLIPEISTQIAMLKTGEIDLASVSAELLPDLKTAGLATEVSAYGGSSLNLGLGGMHTPDDSRYKAGYHNQDPWVDVKVRQALNISIDRAAICKALYAGGATPMGAGIITQDSDKYQFPYDPVKAKQLLIEAGYPNGFTFQVMSWTRPGMPEIPRVLEAVTSYWKNIGLNPKLVSGDWAVYSVANSRQGKTAGQMYPFRISPMSDTLSKLANSYASEATVPLYMDATTNAIYQSNYKLADPGERAAAADKLLKYLFDSGAPVPLVRIAYSFAWNPKKVAPFAHDTGNTYFYLEYVRHAQPLNTFRLFTPWAGR